MQVIVFLIWPVIKKKNNCLRLTQNHITELLVKWNRTYWVKVPNETLPLTRGELFYLRGVVFNLTWGWDVGRILLLSCSPSLYWSWDVNPVYLWLKRELWAGKTTYTVLWGRMDRTSSCWTRLVCWAISHVRQSSLLVYSRCQCDGDPSRLHLPEQWRRAEMSLSE